ncbi:MAG: hypothetical protein ACOCQ3_02655 [Natronomonas sp.]
MEDGVTYSIDTDQRICNAVVDALESEAGVREENIPDRVVDVIESHSLDSLFVDEDPDEWTLTVSCDSLHITVTNRDKLSISGSLNRHQSTPSQNTEAYIL